MMGKRLIRGLCGILLATGLAGTAAAYPDKPIRWIVPFPPGGGGDTALRSMVPALEQTLSQPILVENRPGAGGAAGTSYVAKADPDGYTVLLATIGPMSILPVLRTSLPYDTEKDFAPVTVLNANPFLVIVNPSVEAKSLAELISLAKAKPGKMNFASVGNGSLGHLAGELFKIMAGVDLVHVPYNGGAPAVVDLLGGRVEVMFANVQEALPHVKAGKLRALAVTSLTRIPQAPEYPTLDELGLRGFEAIAWNGVAVPSRTPKPVVNRLHEAIIAALKKPDVVKKFDELGLTAIGNSPAEFAVFMQAERKKWSEVAKKSGATID